MTFGSLYDGRYTDFCVNEILPSGQVLHLDNLDLPNAGKEDVEQQSGAAIESSTPIDANGGTDSTQPKEQDADKEKGETIDGMDEADSPSDQSSGVRVFLRSMPCAEPDFSHRYHRSIWPYLSLFLVIKVPMLLFLSTMRY